MQLFVPLLWKDFRCHTHLFICAMAALLLPIPLTCFQIIASADSEVTLDFVFGASLVFGSCVGFCIAQVVLLCLGGNLLAGERVGRTFEFLFAQPISRGAIAFSKLTFALSLMTSLCVLAGFLQWLGYRLGNADQIQGMQFLTWAEIVAGGMLFFSASWLVSTKLPQPILAITIGAALSGFALSGIFMVVKSQGLSDLLQNQLAHARIAIELTLAVSLVSVGAYFFVKRIEP